MPKKRSRPALAFFSCYRLHGDSQLIRSEFAGEEASRSMTLAFLDSVRQMSTGTSPCPCRWSH